MPGARTRRPATLLVVVATLTALMAGATQAGAAPAASKTTTFTLHFPSVDGVSAAATIVCTARTNIALGQRLGDYYAYGTGVSECPVAMENLVAQTSLWKWSVDLARWDQVVIGNYANGPGKKAESRTSDYYCGSEPHDYIAATYHFARLGNATATAVSTSPEVTC